MYGDNAPHASATKILLSGYLWLICKTHVGSLCTLLIICTMYAMFFICIPGFKDSWFLAFQQMISFQATNDKFSGYKSFKRMVYFTKAIHIIYAASHFERVIEIIIVYIVCI